jgi:hypothetical protein
MQQWIWGKHAIGLSAREHWGFESRLALLFAGMKLLFCSKNPVRRFSTHNNSGNIGALKA